MLIHQYISEFNELANKGKLKFLSMSDEVNLTNKLKLIQSQFIDDEVEKFIDEEFFSNLYHLLCQANNIKQELLGNCLDILNVVMNSRNNRLRKIVSGDSRLLSVLISNVLQVNSDVELIKILTVVQDLLSFGNELDEHNLMLIVEVLQDYSENTSNPEVRSLCVKILIDLCLTNNQHSARYIITKKFKATQLKDIVKSLNDDILSFKLLILLEDELTAKDLNHFVRLSLPSISTSDNFDLLAVKQSIDVLRHYEKQGVYSNSNISDDEEVTKKLQLLNDSLILKLQSAENSNEKTQFFELIMQFYNMLLQLESGLVKEFKDFVDVAFIIADISMSSHALKFLTKFVEYGGVLESPELVVESLVHCFVEKEKTRVVYDQIYAFISILSPLDEKNLLNDQVLGKIEEYFNDIISKLEQADISQMEDEEVFHFVYFLHSLTRFASNRPAFLVKLNKILQLDSCPVLYSRAYRSTKKEILELLLKLSGTKNFPIQAVAKILSEDITRTGKAPPSNISNFRKQDNNKIVASRIISRVLTNEFELLVKRVNLKLDNDEPVDSKDLMQLYRQKIKGLNDQLESVTSSLDNVSRQLTEHQQRIVSFRSISEKQEFKLWCVQMDKDRMCKEVRVMNSQNALLKQSVEVFKASAFNKDEEDQKILGLKNLEIEQLKAEKKKIDEKIHTMKESLNTMIKENESRIEELKAEVASAKAEHKKSHLKFVAAEKEIQKLQEVIKLHEKDVCAKQEKLQQYEVELKEAEQMKMTIMNLMQTRSFKK